MISVIIPVYNTEKYLGRCIDSVLNSTYQNFELLLINDGSGDGSAGICKEYEKKDPRIQYFEQKNQGVSVARNRGIEESRGEWIIFVDSDDFITDDFLSTVAREENRQYDLLAYDYILLREESGGASDAAAVFPIRSIHHYEGEEKILLTKKVLNGEAFAENGQSNPISIWAKAYKRSVIIGHSLRFPTNIAIGEDEIFNIEYIHKTDSCLYEEKTVYYYFIRPDSSLHKFRRDAVQSDIIRQSRLRNSLQKQAVFGQVREAYYNGVLFGMADLLIKQIFNPGNTIPFKEKCSLCREMRENNLYMDALAYNRRLGRISRRILLDLFEKRYWQAVRLLCVISYRILERAGRI